MKALRVTRRRRPDAFNGERTQGRGSCHRGIRRSLRHIRNQKLHLDRPALSHRSAAVNRRDQSLRRPSPTISTATVHG